MTRHYIGLMSGTSLDGTDGVVAAEHGDRLRVISAVHVSFSAGLRRRLLALNAPGPDEIERAALASAELSAIYARAVRMLLARSRLRPRAVAAIGCHGQTVRHRPEAGYTTQLVDAARLAELSDIAVVCDFRSRDIAAGGEGAPLAPALHRAMFHDARRNRAVVNIGGMANVTHLPARGPTTGFDCGPGNVLLDAWIQEKRGVAFDRNGAWAASGRVDSALLRRLLRHPFLRRRPPKSTGRHEFNPDWLTGELTGAERAADVQATLLEFTATTVARALRGCRPGVQEVYLCGGGARNRALVARLQSLSTGMRIHATDALGVAAEHVEALAFAWLARQAIRGRPGNLPSVTGAAGPRVLGAIYPR